MGKRHVNPQIQLSQATPIHISLCLTLKTVSKIGKNCLCSPCSVCVLHCCLCQQALVCQASCGSHLVVHDVVVAVVDAAAIRPGAQRRRQRLDVRRVGDAVHRKPPHTLSTKNQPRLKYQNDECRLSMLESCFSLSRRNKSQSFAS